jgi:hypothetical protein
MIVCRGAMEFSPFRYLTVLAFLPTRSVTTERVERFPLVDGERDLENRLKNFRKLLFKRSYNELSVSKNAFS